MIDQAGEWRCSCPALLAAQAALILACYLVLRALHRRRAGTALFFLNFLFLTVGVGAALLVAKFEALAYFSDAMGFELIRNLGGGSLVHRRRSTFSTKPPCWALPRLGAALAYWVAYRLVRRYLPGSGGAAPIRCAGATLLGLLLLCRAARPARRPAARRPLRAEPLHRLRDDQPRPPDRLTDFDRDGYSGFSAQRDGAPFDPARHPLALDIPGNGVDEDGFGGDFRFTAGARGGAEARAAREARSISW